MKVRLTVEGSIAARLLRRTGANTFQCVIDESLGLLDHATETVEHGGFILSIGEDGTDPIRYTTPGLEGIRAE